MSAQKDNFDQPFEFTVPSHILDDLCCRFIINVPYQEKKDLVRICFQIEQAHWFYLDFYNKFNESTRRPCSLKEFARNIFYHIRYLRPFAKDLDFIIDDWKEYKYCVPTFGAIILDEDNTHVLLVQSYWSKSSWGFPKGKINKDETPCHCAAREVYEETGFNISMLIHPDSYVEVTINDQCIRLYIVCGVSKSTKFIPQTRNEIKDIKWFPLDAIPIKKTKVKNKLHSQFYMVIPFMRDLRKWILQNGAPKVTKQRRSFKSFSEVEDLLQTTSADGEVPAIFYPVSNTSQPPHNNKFYHHDGNENEFYEGSDEDNVKQSNEEIYGIPKVKMSPVSGKDVDAYLLTCSDVSYIKKNRIKNNLDGNQALVADKDSMCLIANKFENTLKPDKNSDKTFFPKKVEKKSSLNSSNNNFNSKTPKNVNSVTFESKSSLNNTKTKDKARKNIFNSVHYSNEKATLGGQKISNHLNDPKTSNSFKSKNALPEQSYEFVQRISNNKGIRAVQCFKLNREALYKAIEQS